MAKKKKKKSTTGRKLKKQQKHAVKRKQKRKQLARLRDALLHPSLSKAASWPLHEVLISKTWRDPMQLTQIMVVRRGPAGWYAMGSALVDQACLGVKSAFGRVVDELGYRKHRSHMMETQELIPADINLVAKIIREAIAYARSFGIEPDPDVRETLILLGDADPDACEEEIPLGGPDGKPFFFAGPYDNVPKILKTLEKHLGPDGFTYVVPIELSDFEGDDDIEIIPVEEWDEWDEDDTGLDMD